MLDCLIQAFASVEMDYAAWCPDRNCPAFHGDLFAPLSHVSPHDLLADAYIVDGVFVCPTTGTRWIACEAYHYGSEAHDGWIPDTTHQPEQVDGEWYCDPDRHDYRTCDTCGTGEWIHQDDLYSPCDGDGYFCNRHWNGCNCSDCNPYDEDDYDDGENDLYDNTMRCSTCNTDPLHMNLLTETHLCDCQAARAIDQGTPVKLHHKMATVTVPNPEWVDAVIDAIEEFLLWERFIAFLTRQPVAA